MRQVQVLGTGMVPFAKSSTGTLQSFAAPAVREAMAEAGMQSSDVDMATCGTVFGGMLAGQRILHGAGISGIPVINVEGACSSGSAALHVAWQQIAAGAWDTAIVVGAEQLSRLGGGTIPLIEDDPEVARGAVMPSIYAMRATRYLHETEATKKDLAAVSVKSRRHAERNPLAQQRRAVTVEEVLASRPISEPLTLLQCCPSGDGAAALVLTAADVAHRFESRVPVTISASQLTAGTFMPADRDITRSEVTQRCAQRAYEQAGVGPGDLDLAEVHDAFTIAELIYYEALGLCSRGDAAGFLRDGASSLGGDVVVNPSGGLLSRGHPLGATGVAQAVESVRQLQGVCGPRQVAGARTALTHTTGGGLSGVDHGACSVHVFQR